MVEKGMPHPTIFEVETAMAFCYFKEECCDYVLLEVGMGGREDATNLISHPGLLGAYFDQHGPYAVLRGYDRTDRLGEGRDYQGKLSGSDSRAGTVRGRSAFCDKEGSGRKTCPVTDCKSVGSKADREQSAGNPFLRTRDWGGKHSTHGRVSD